MVWQFLLHMKVESLEHVWMCTPDPSLILGPADYRAASGIPLRDNVVLLGQPKKTLVRADRYMLLCKHRWGAVNVEYAAAQSASILL